MVLASTSITSSADLSQLWSISGIFGLIFYVLIAIALWRTFDKAGYAGVLAIIPIVNLFVLTKVANLSAWLTLLYIIPIVNIIFGIIVAVRVGKGFDKGGAFSFFLLWLVAFIGYFIVGFGSARYDKSRIV